MLRPFDSSHLERFWELASLDEQKRRTAACEIVGQLAEAQAGEQRDQKVAYTLKRLVRGLQSSRDGARQGYSLALTELLCTYEDITAARVLQLVDETMLTTSSMKGQEERDVYFGRIFACMSLVRCGRLLAGDSVRVAQLLVSAAEKTFLREVSAELLGELASKRSFAEFEADLLPMVNSFLGDSTSVDAVSLVAKLRISFPLKRPGTNCPRIWNSHPLVHPANLAAITSALKNSTSNHPHIHTVWTYVLSDLGSDKAQYLPTLWREVVEGELLTSTHERRYLAFELFCRLAPQVVGSDTLSAGGWSGLLRCLLSPKFVRCLANNLAQPSNYLYVAAQKCVTAIRKMARSDTGVHRLEIITALLLGDLNFDRLSNTKLAAQEIARLTAGGLVAFRDFIHGVFNGEHRPRSVDSNTDGPGDGAEKGEATSSSEEAETIEHAGEIQFEKQQMWAVGQIYGLANAPNADESTQLSLLLFLHAYGFYRLPCDLATHRVLATMGAKKICSCSAGVRSLCRQRFYSLLQNLSSRVVRRLQITDSQRSTASDVSELNEGDHVDGATTDGTFWATHAVMHGQELLECGNIELLQPLSNEASAAVRSAVDARAALQTRINADPSQELTRRLRGVEYLLVNVLLLQLDEPGTTTEILNDIVECSIRVGQSAQTEGDIGRTEDLDPITVLVDCMLSLLTRPSALTREVVRVVFKSFTEDLHEPAFDLLIHALTATMGEDEEESESDDEDVDQLPEIELGSDDEGEDENEDDGEDEDEDDDDDEDDGSDGEDDRQQQHENTGVERPGADVIQPVHLDSDEDMYDEEQEEADLDDDEMFKQGFNEKLAQILRLSQENRKKSQEDKRRASAHWKLRVLDLIEIFIKRQPRSQLLLRLPGPLLECIQQANVFKEEAAASERCSGVVLKLSRSKEVPACNTPKIAQQVEETIARLLEGLFHTPAPVKVAVASIGYLIRVRDTGDRSAVAETMCSQIGAQAAVMPLLKKAYVQSLERRTCRLQPKFFGELAQRRPTKWLADAMLQQMVPATTSAAVASPYLRAEATAVLQRLISMQTSAEVQTVVVLQDLTDVLIGALRSATKIENVQGSESQPRLLPQRAKQALTFGQAVVAFARRLADAERAQPALSAKWIATGATENVEATLASMVQVFDQVPSIKAHCERLLSTIRSIWLSDDAKHSGTGSSRSHRKRARVR